MFGSKEFMKQTIIFLDGQLLTANEKRLVQLLPWRLRGRGVFETILVLNGKIVFLRQHLGRLFEGLLFLKLKSPYSKRQLERILYWAVGVNAYTHARLRLTVWRDKKGPHTTVVVTSIAKRYPKSFKICVAAKRVKTASPAQRIKSIEYKFFADAYKAAQKRGCDESVILDKQGEVVEACRSNIFIVKRSVVYTPQLKSGCLNGIVRQVVLALAHRTGLKIKQTRLGLEDLCSADEIFLTSSIIGVMPVHRLRGQKEYKIKAGPTTVKIKRLYETSILEE